MDIQQINPAALALFIAALTLLPLLMIISTSFLKISVVLLIVRNALGIQQVPGNMVIYSISLAATLFIMGPVFNEMTQRVRQISPDKIDVAAIYTHYPTVIAPLQKFLQRNIDAQTHIRLTEAAKKLWKDQANNPITRDNPVLILSAFVLSELQSGFKIGFLIYIPFLVIDLVVSTVLMALGMQMVAPMFIAIPLKLLLFVLIEGWSRLLEGLFYSYL